MDHKRKHFYGTPLNKTFQDQDGFKEEEGCSRNRRKERLDRQQTVRDDQGRQRFHGAFTGGFSAGYFNTVDSVAGFKPKQFVSKRGANKQHGERFSHQPEDYMDEEDLGEFGIAPKKIRLVNQYQLDNNRVDLFSANSSITNLRNIPRSTSKQTIGEKILEQINNNFQNKRFNLLDNFVAPKFEPKNNFHGLGYKPLKAKEGSFKPTNPLTAVLERGKRIKISGEAFGTGVLDDEEDYFVSTSDTYGYDDLSNYNFDKEKTKLPQVHQQQPRKYASDHVTGFILSKANDDGCCTTVENLLKAYPHPKIPITWKQPRRQSESSQIKINLNFIHKPSTSSDVLKTKFTHSSDILVTDELKTKAGLLSYSDLSKVAKASKTNILPEQVELVQATISREKFEWRPCSLLCKHFNVPNPFPDNLFCGVKESQIHTKSIPKTESIEAESYLAKPLKKSQVLASMELKRSIYDVTIQTVIPSIASNYREISEQTIDDNRDEIDVEELPQVVDILDNDKKIDFTRSQLSSSDDSEVEELPILKKEPELIILSSSDEDDSNSYGPPLPPTLKTLIDANQHNQSKSMEPHK